MNSTRSVFIVELSSFSRDVVSGDKEKNSLDDTTISESFPPLSTPVTTTAGNASGKSSYANITNKPSGKKVNVEKKVAYPVVVNYISSIDGLDAMLENGPWFIQNTSLILKEWHPYENLLKEDVSIAPVWVKLHGVPVTAFSEDGLSAIAIKLDCEEAWSNLSRCSGWSKMAFKPQKEYRRVTKKPNASSSGNKKKGLEPSVEVSNSNTFDVLNSVDNDVKFGNNGGTTNLINNEATLSGSSFININNDGEFSSNTPIGEKIGKIERQICKDKLRLLDNEGNPLVPTGIVESDSEAKLVFDETSNLRISTSVFIRIPSRLLKGLNQLQPGNSKPVQNTQRFKEKSGESYTSSKEVKDSHFISDDVTKVAHEYGGKNLPQTDSTHKDSDKNDIGMCIEVLKSANSQEQSRILENDVPSHRPRKQQMGGHIFGAGLELTVRFSLRVVEELNCILGRGKERITWSPGINHHLSERKWNTVRTFIMNNHVFQNFRPNDDQHERRIVQRRVWDLGITRGYILKQHLMDKVFWGMEY
nr:hypothetical protein [Tanacetum cinerariifolium]